VLVVVGTLLGRLRTLQPQGTLKVTARQSAWRRRQHLSDVIPER
jgi:hypothetical protein